MFEALYVSSQSNVIFDIFPLRPSYAVHFYFPSFNHFPMPTIPMAQICLSNILHYHESSVNQQGKELYQGRNWKLVGKELLGFFLQSMWLSTCSYLRAELLFLFSCAVHFCCVRSLSNGR